MTLLSIRNQLIGHFIEQSDTFGSDDFASIRVDEELAESRDALVRAALDQLIELGLVTRVNDGLWILSAPLNAAGQDVHISMGVANAIAATINTYLDANEVESGNRADALNITEGHLVAILEILGDILNTEPKGS